MSGDKIEKSGGSLTSSCQGVHPTQWMDNARQLMAEYSRKESRKKAKSLSALVKVMDRLTCTLPMVFGEVVKYVVPGVMEFDDAFKIYEENLQSEACDMKQLEVTFLHQVCNERIGLPVVILSHTQYGKWIFLKSSNTSLEFVFSTLLDKCDEEEEFANLDFSYSEIKSFMSSDFDRQLLDLTFSAGKSKSHLLKLGINIASTTEDVKEKIDAIINVEQEAEAKANLKLDSEIISVEKSIQAKKTKLEVKKYV